MNLPPIPCCGLYRAWGSRRVLTSPNSQTLGVQVRCTSRLRTKISDYLGKNWTDGYLSLPCGARKEFPTSLLYNIMQLAWQSLIFLPLPEVPGTGKLVLLIPFISTAVNLALNLIVSSLIGKLGQGERSLGAKGASGPCCIPQILGQCQFSALSPGFNLCSDSHQQPMSLGEKENNLCMVYFDHTPDTLQTSSNARVHLFSSAYGNPWHKGYFQRALCLCFKQCETSFFWMDFRPME